MGKQSGKMYPPVDAAAAVAAGAVAGTATGAISAKGRKSETMQSSGSMLSKYRSATGKLSDGVATDVAGASGRAEEEAAAEAAEAAWAAAEAAAVRTALGTQSGLMGGSEEHPEHQMSGAGGPLKAPKKSPGSMFGWGSNKAVKQMEAAEATARAAEAGSYSRSLLSST